MYNPKEYCFQFIVTLIQIYFKFSCLPAFPHISFLLLLTNKSKCEVRMICIKQHENETEQFLASCKIKGILFSVHHDLDEMSQSEGSEKA